MMSSYRLLRLPHFGELLSGKKVTVRKELRSEDWLHLSQVPSSLTMLIADSFPACRPCPLKYSCLRMVAPKGIVGILLHRFEDGVILGAELLGALLLIRIEDDVHAFRQVVTVQRPCL